MSSNNKEKNRGSFIRKLLSPWRKSIRTKFLTAMVILALIPSVIATGILSTNHVKNNQQTLNDNAFLVSKYVNNQLDLLLNQYDIDVNSIAGIPGVTILLNEIHSQNFTNFRNSWPAEDLNNGSIYVNYFMNASNNSQIYGYVLTAINTMTRLSLDIDLVRVFADDGNLVIGSENGTQLLNDFKGDKIWFKRVMNQTIVKSGKILYSSINIGSTTKKGTLRILKPIDVNGQRLGFVIINYNLKSIQKVLENIQIKALGSLKAFVIDLHYENAEGHVVGPVIISSSRYENLAFKEKAPLTNFPVEQISNSQGKIEFILNGVETTYFYVVNDVFKELPVPKTILIGLEAPSKDISPNYMPTIITLLIVLILVTAFALIFAEAITKSNTDFINEIIYATNEIKEGNLSFSLNPKLLNREDESGEIARRIEEIRIAFVNLIKPTLDMSEQVSGYTEQLYLASSEIERSSKEIGDSFREITKSVSLQAEKNNEVMNLLSEHSELVSKVLDETFTILDILKDTIEETTFIALNAQIEAARAGAMGRGFMVVASSIRELAATGKERLKEIEKAMTQLRENIESSVNKILSNTVDLSASAEEMSAISEESLATLLEEIDLLKEMTTLIQRLNSMTNKLTEDLKRFRLQSEE